MYNPKQFRMGDIFYKIQEKINKTGRPQDEELTKQQKEIRAKKLEEWNEKRRKKISDDSDSEELDAQKTKTKNDKYELAEKIKNQIKADPTSAIQSEIFYDKHILNFLTNKGLEEKQRMAGIIMAKTNLDDLVKFTLKFYKDQKKVTEGNRQARELQSIAKGQLLKNPEFIARKKKERIRSLMASETRNSPLSTTQRSLPARSNLTIDTRNIHTV